MLFDTQLGPEIFRQLQTMGLETIEREQRLFDGGEDPSPGCFLTQAHKCGANERHQVGILFQAQLGAGMSNRDRKSTRLNSSHLVISYAVFCLKKKKIMCLMSL